MLPMHRAISTAAVCLALGAHAGAQTDQTISVRHLQEPGTDMRNSHYVSNRPPLEPSRLIKLPIGSIRPQGWLAHQLRLQADGFHGHLMEISPFLDTQGNAWLDPKGRGERGWEEVPYWLKGYLNCAYVLNDEQMIAEAHRWIEGALNSQQDDGWFGPDEGRTGLATKLRGRDDLWPNMIMLYCLMDYHDVTRDERVITLMQRYFRYLEKLPEDKFLVGYWPKIRAGDQLAAIHWLFNRTGEDWLLPLAEKTHRHTARWDEGLIDWHNVNIAQAFREPTQWWVQSHDDAHRRGAERNWTQIRQMYGQVPGGMFGADENCRPGYDDPHQAVETCGLVEEMLSDEILLGLTGDMVWADRCEDVAFNMLPAAFTADMGALRYLTAPNQPVSDAENHSPGIQNGGPMFLMSPHRHRCCQHNAGHGWPYYAQHLWYATPDNGLAAVLYSASTVTARVGKDTEVTIEQQTRYPFGDTVRFNVRLAAPAKFPLYFRIPAWCDDPGVRINGQVVKENAQPGQLLRVERQWADDDRVELTLPMQVRVRTWEANHGSVSVDRGPLTYALDIGENYRRYEDAGAQNKELTDAQVAELNRTWPAYEILPAGAWNFGLLPEEPIRVEERGAVAEGSPWTPDASPIVLWAKARKIPQWKVDQHGLVGALQDSPAFTEEPVETVRLIPMGAARIRISAFPVAGSDSSATTWTEPKQTFRKQFNVSASHTHETDTATAAADSIVPEHSGDRVISRHTFWPNKGTLEWVQASFDKPRRVRSVSVYWFDDAGDGFCRVPASWTLSYREGDTWHRVATTDEFGVYKDQFNTVTFEPVYSDALRLEVQLQDEFSAGVLEWKVE
ncbi:MAG: hypothetical protein DYG94_11655 [Leptolyngbya sp. PLA3]|nr:MAG: hypothetical protein EDM82_11795 [Cyanobacteria bacterium CYA]MCE7969380.1 hypothetical protein [Leptolyngbya sp. PL-A3]